MKIRWLILAVLAGLVLLAVHLAYGVDRIPTNNRSLRDVNWALSIVDRNLIEGPLNNDTATRDPVGREGTACTSGLCDDRDDGYAALSLWLNTSSGEAFICTNATPGASTWVSLAEGGLGVMGNAWTVVTADEGDDGICDASDDTLKFAGGTGVATASSSPGELETITFNAVPGEINLVDLAGWPLTTAGDILYFTTVPVRLGIGDSGYFLKSTGSAPSWAQIMEADIGDLSHFTPTTLDVDYGAETITSLFTFDRDTDPPFAVTAGSAVVTNLDADKWEGQDANIGAVTTGDILQYNSVATEWENKSLNDAGIAPNDGEYLMLSGDLDLSNERVLVIGWGLDFTDLGADNTYTIDCENASTTNKGCASFNTTHFSVGYGAVSAKASTALWNANALQGVTLSEDTPATGELLAYNVGGTSKWAPRNINEFTVDGSPDGAADYVLTWDNSASTHKAVLLDSLPGDGGALQLSDLTDVDSATQTDGFVIASAGGNYSGQQLSHTKLSDKGTNTHAQIDTHLASTSNPHTVTASQVGNTTAQWNADKLQDNAIEDLTLGAGQDDYILKWDNGTSTLKWEADAGGGETNTASNSGTDGVGVFDQKVGVDLEFRNIAPGSNKVTVTLDAGDDDIDLDILEANIDHDSLSGFVGNEHVNHSTVSITAGTGLTGGGDLTATRNLAIENNVELPGTSAFRVPDGTSAQEPSEPCTGGFIRYDIDTDKFRGCEAGAWANMIGSGGGGNAWTTIVVDTDTNPTADTSTDSITIIGGQGITVGGSDDPEQLTLSIVDNVQLPGNAAVTVVKGSTAQRPVVVSEGELRYNTTTSSFEGYENGAWVNLTAAGGSTVTSGSVIADNAVVRGDGGVRGVQGSSMFVSDVSATIPDIIDLAQTGAGQDLAIYGSPDTDGVLYLFGTQSLSGSGGSIYLGPSGPNGTIVAEFADDGLHVTGNIAVSGTVDGVDVANHDGRHERAGADEIDGDHLDIDYTPDNYAPDTTPAEAANVDDLAAHLHGINEAIGAAEAQFEIRPFSTFIVTENRVWMGYHETTGGLYVGGLQVEGSLGADATVYLFWQLPNPLPPGMVSFAMDLICDDPLDTKVVKWDVCWNSIGNGVDPDSVTLNCEGTRTAQKDSGDGDEMLDTSIALDHGSSTLTAGNVLITKLVFETASWTLQVTGTFANLRLTWNE